MGQPTLRLGLRRIGLERADGIRRGNGGDASFDFVREQSAQLLIFSAQLGVLLREPGVLFAQLADAFENLLQLLARRLVVGGSLGGSRFIRRHRSGEQSAEQDHPRKSEAAHRQVESLRVHKPTR